MRPVAIALPCLSICLLLALATACRDEQAGPKGRGGAATGDGKPVFLDRPPENLHFRSGAQFGAQGPVYLGATVDPVEAKPGATVTVRHYFISPQGMGPKGWSLFVHAVDAESGEMLANLDHPLQGGRAPLGSWPAGKVVEDVHSFPLPEAPSGSVELRLGFWKGDQRLPILTASADDGSGRMRGPPVGRGATQRLLPEYRVPHTDKAPTIDGVIDPAEWKNAPIVRLNRSRDGRPARFRTDARMLWDSDHLYVAFDVRDPDVWGTHRKRDAKLYEEEVVELFIDADGDGRTYNELQVSPHNVIFDAAFPERRKGMDLSWDSGVKSAVKVRGTLDDPTDRDEGWTVELQLPLARLSAVPRLPPVEGDRWRFNLYRLEHHSDRKRIEGQSFSPLMVGDFHALKRFGWLTFVGGPAPSASGAPVPSGTSQAPAHSDAVPE